MKKLIVALTMIAGGLFAFGDGDNTQPANWSAQHNTTDVGSIRSDGTLVYAYARGTYMVNGVAFTGITAADYNADKNIDNADLFWSVSSDLTGTSGEIVGIEDAAYLSLLKACWPLHAAPQIVLRNLTPGRSYLVQIVGCRTESNDAMVAVPEANDDSIFICVGNNETRGYTGWDYGGSLIGTFVAEATTRTITLKYLPNGADWAAFNAIQVRELPYLIPTADAASNTSRIQSAIDAAVPNGTVALGEGTFLINAQLNVTGGVTLVGAGMDKTTVKPASGSSIRLTYVDDGAKVAGMTLTGGSAQYGAGAWVKNGTVSWCRISNNYASFNDQLYKGAGVSFVEGQGQVDHCILTGNTGNTNFGGQGVGITASTGEVLVDSCLIYGNKTASTTGWGAAIGMKNANYNCTVRNCTIVNNTCTFNGAVYGEGGTGKIILVNDIVAGNMRYSGLECNISGNLIDASQTKNCLFGLESEVKTGMTDCLFGDPEFVNATYGNYRLSDGSPALGAGTTYTGLDKDLNNVAFAATPALGCYEGAMAAAPVASFARADDDSATVTLTSGTVGATIYYTLDGSDPTTASTVYGEPFVVSGTKTIKAIAVKEGVEASPVHIACHVAATADAAANRTAIQSALDSVTSGSVVALGAGLFTIDTQLMLANGVTLLGQGWEKSVVKQTTSGSSSRCATIDGGAVLEKVTVTGGRMTGGNYSFGGGIWLKDGTVSWCCISNNTITTANTKWGGGIGLFKGKGTIDHCYIADNLASTATGNDATGGGIGMYQVGGEVLIDSCLIAANRAYYTGTLYGQGGAIGVDFNNSKNPVTVRNCTIVGNQAGNGGSAVSTGGAIYTRSDKYNMLAMVNCIFADNVTEGASTTIGVASTVGIDSCLFDIEADKVGDHSLFGDPAFVDPDNRDYHLGGTSPACSAGVTYAGIGVGLDGVAFAEQPSMGCYEAGVVTEVPAFDPADGVIFHPTTNVTLTCATAGATITYTTDGSVPTADSTPYTAPITLSETTTIRARAFADGMGPSPTVTATYYHVRPVPKPEEFKKCVEITLGSDLATTEIATGLPALVKLSESTITGFLYSDFTLPNGADMMFVDTDGNVLAHEVDTWDVTGESLVWVRLPSSAANTKIILYYGNGTTSIAEASGVWTDYVGVWHLNETTAPKAENSYGTYANSTATADIDGNVAAITVTNETGRIGKCFRTNDSTGKQSGNFNYGGVWVNDSGSNSPVDGGENFTISGWFKHGNFPYYYDHYFYKRSASGNTGSPNNAFAIESNSNGPKNPQIYPRGSSGTGKAVLSVDSLVDSWDYITFVYSGSTCYVYRNGAATGNCTITACIDNDAALAFGNNCKIANGSVGDAAYNGWIDEVRFAKGSQDANWVAAEYKAMNMEADDIFTYGEAKDIEPATTVKRPVFDPAETTFGQPISVTLTSATDGASIYYTTDGSDPTEASTLYEAPIAVSETVTIKARAFKAEMDPSAIVSATYTYEAQTPPAFGTVTFLPRLTKATLNGTIASVGNLGATACDVYLSLDGAAATKIATDATTSFSYELTGLTAKEYAYTLSLSNNAATVMGAETSGSFTVRNANPVVAPVAGDAAATRAAVQDALDTLALEPTAGVVTLDEGLFALDAQLMVTNGVTLVGQGWDKTILKFAGVGNQGDSRVATLSGGSTLSRVTVTGAQVGQNQYVGGAVSIEGTAGATVSWCCITNNLNNNGFGGGIGVSATGLVTIDHSIIAKNTSGYERVGGGIGTRPNAAGLQLEINSCLVYGNTSTASNCGAGIGLMHKNYDETSNLTSLTVNIRNTTIAGNSVTGTGKGGGIYSTQKNVTLTNCIVADNSPTGDEISCLNDTVAAAITKVTTLVGGTTAFVDSANGDYHLKGGYTTAIRQGTTYTGIGVDLDNVDFAATPSLGCYEYVKQASGMLILFK